MGSARCAAPGTALQRWRCLVVSQTEAGGVKYVTFSRTHKKTYMDSFSRGYIAYRKFWRYKRVCICIYGML